MDGKGSLGVPSLAVPGCCCHFVSGSSSCHDVVDSAVRPPNATHHLHPELTPGPRVISHKGGLQGKGVGGQGGHCERHRMVPIVSTAGPESAVSPGESIAIWAELAAKSFFLGCSCAQKKVYSSCKTFACAMCQHTHAACASVCVCTDLSPKQLLFFDCSTSIALPSFVHVAELLCEVSAAPKRLLLLWTDVRWCACVDKGTHAHNHRVILSQRFSRCSQSNYYRLP